MTKYIFVLLTLENAVNNPTTINMDLVYAQQSRQILDLIVGFKITPLLWKHIVSNTKNSLSAGRCQSPALRLVYDNYKEIQQSPGKLSFNSIGYFTSKNIPFALNFNHLSHEAIKDFLEKSKTFDHVFSREKEKEVTSLRNGVNALLQDLLRRFDSILLKRNS